MRRILFAVVTTIATTGALAVGVAAVAVTVMPADVRGEKQDVAPIVVPQELPTQPTGEDSPEGQTPAPADPASPAPATTADPAAPEVAPPPAPEDLTGGNGTGNNGNGNGNGGGNGTGNEGNGNGADNGNGNNGNGNGNGGGNGTGNEGNGNGP